MDDHDVGRADDFISGITPKLVDQDEGQATLMNSTEEAERLDPSKSKPCLVPILYSSQKLSPVHSPETVTFSIRGKPQPFLDWTHSVKDSKGNDYYKSQYLRSLVPLQPPRCNSVMKGLKTSFLAPNVLPSKKHGRSVGTSLQRLTSPYKNKHNKDANLWQVERYRQQGKRLAQETERRPNSSHAVKLPELTGSQSLNKIAGLFADLHKFARSPAYTAAQELRGRAQEQREKTHVDREDPTLAKVQITSKSTLGKSEAVGLKGNLPVSRLLVEVES